MHIGRRYYKWFQVIHLSYVITLLKNFTYVKQHDIISIRHNIEVKFTIKNSEKLGLKY